MTQNAARDDSPDGETSQVCIPNIGPAERKKRVRIGAVLLAVGAVLGASLVLAEVHPLWRLVAFLPIWAGATSLWQVREKTCVALASRGVRNMDQGEVEIGDAKELQQIHRQARRVTFEGLATAVIATLLLLALP